MIICVLLIAHSALAGINYFINQLILHYTLYIYSINSRKPITSNNQGLQLAACPKGSSGAAKFPRTALIQYSSFFCSLAINKFHKRT